MSEAELRECLRDAVADEPPLDFDPDALIERGEHLRKRRRALVAVGVATLALTATVLTLPGVLGGQRSAQVAGPPLITTAESAPSSAVEVPQVTPTGIPGDAAKTARAEVLSSRLRVTFAKFFPRTKVVEIDVKEVEEPAAGQRAAMPMMFGTVVFIDDYGRAELNIAISEQTPMRDPVQFCADTACEKRLPQQDGSTVTLGTIIDEASGRITVTAAHFRRDGVLVQVNAHNFDPAQGTAKATRPGPAADYDQLLLLATDRALTTW
ncbi:uncharacterized protein YcfJ [Saccharothrix coeruleofusca]|uniref:hypothetical protein n=1 Tax=Saccharothrix coeruleofusca TaxID=33919 RepID=UPI001AE9D22E|nr:hypothetical protein [Saccharothrix coeruleofusca]MBP2339706.1 uncharacterized protein YcfJ [Saccharothrix coeruleofusca]